MIDFASARTEVRGLRIHDISAGSGDGLPVVMLHGLAVSHRYFLPAARELAARRRVVVPDLPGFGRSGKPPHAYGVSQHAETLAAWLDRRRLDRICLLGHSFGAEVAARLAVLRPDVVAGLVLAAPTTDPVARSRRALVRRFGAIMFVEQPWQVPVLTLDVAVARPWRVWATVGHSARNAIEKDLVELPVRPLVLGGRLDAIAPRRWRAEVAALTGGTEVTIGEAAHNVLSTSPRRSAAAIDAYISAL